MSRSNILRGSRVNPKDPETKLFTDASNICWGAHVDSLRCLVPRRENTPHQCARVESDTTSHVPLAEATQKPHSPCCNGQRNCSVLQQEAGGTRSTSLFGQTKQLLLMCQQEGIASRARHIPGKLNVLADVLSHPTQMSGTEWSLHLSVFQAITQEWGMPTLDLFSTRWNCKLPLFVSSVPDPSAMAVDALSMSWKAMWLMPTLRQLCYHRSSRMFNGTSAN